jgi:hypothetical protein
MGKSSFLIVMGLVITIGIFGAIMNRNSTSAIDNSTSYFTRESARNANNSALQLALRKLSDSTDWRGGYPTLSVFQSNVRLSITDTINNGKKWMKLVTKSTYFSDSLRSKLDTLTTTVVVQGGFVPWSLRGAFTAFGPLDWTISDMLIDGRDHDSVVQLSGPPVIYTALPKNGIYGVSTGAPAFVNSQNALIGGTLKTASPYVDYSPAFPNDPAVVETNSPWPTGFPKTPDEALGWPNGTLKAIAQSGINGSRYITTQAQFDLLVTNHQPLQGITYIEPAATDTYWVNKTIPAGSGGLLAFHCSTGKNAYWKWVLSDVAGQTFKGLMIFDRVHHIHINILGAIMELDPTTVQEGCQGNADKVIAYDSKIIEQLTGSVISKVKGGWRNKLKVLSWYE